MINGTDISDCVQAAQPALRQIGEASLIGLATTGAAIVARALPNGSNIQAQIGDRLNYVAGGAAAALMLVPPLDPLVSIMPTGTLVAGVAAGSYLAGGILGSVVNTLRDAHEGPLTHQPHRLNYYGLRAGTALALGYAVLNNLF